MSWARCAPMRPSVWLPRPSGSTRCPLARVWPSLGAPSTCSIGGVPTGRGGGRRSRGASARAGPGLPVLPLTHPARRLPVKGWVPMMLRAKRLRRINGCPDREGAGCRQFGAAGETPPPALARHRDIAIGSLAHPTSPTESRGEPDFTLGTTEVTCTARDASGNRSESGFTVTVKQGPAPVPVCDPYSPPAPKSTVSGTTVTGG